MRGEQGEEEIRLKKTEGEGRERERGKGAECDVGVLHGHYVRTYEQHDTR